VSSLIDASTTRRRRGKTIQLSYRRSLSSSGLSSSGRSSLSCGRPPACSAASACRTLLQPSLCAAGRTSACGRACGLSCGRPCLHRRAGLCCSHRCMRPVVPFACEPACSLLCGRPTVRSSLVVGRLLQTPLLAFKIRQLKGF
jgi:hypothetical protein